MLSAIQPVKTDELKSYTHVSKLDLPWLSPLRSVEVSDLGGCCRHPIASGPVSADGSRNQFSIEKLSLVIPMLRRISTAGMSIVKLPFSWSKL